jgi:hypothetical protein
MNTDLNVAGTMMTSWLLSPCCLHAGIRDHQGSAGSAVAAATEMSAELLFAVLAVIVLFGVAIVVSSLGKPLCECCFTTFGIRARPRPRGPAQATLVRDSHLFEVSKQGGGIEGAAYIRRI